jgi:hypothetical protein
MTREEFEFMRKARATLRTVQVSANGPAVTLAGSSPSRIALLLFPAAEDYVVGTGPDLDAQRIVVRSDGAPIQLLLEHVGDLVQQPFWAGSGMDITVSFVETVMTT